MLKEMVAIVSIAFVIGAFLFWQNTPSEKGLTSIAALTDSGVESEKRLKHARDVRAGKSLDQGQVASFSERAADEGINDFIDPLALGAESIRVDVARKPISVGSFIDPLGDGVVVFTGMPTIIGTFKDPLGFVEEASTNRVEVGAFVDPDMVQGISLTAEARISVGEFIDPREG